VFNHAIAKAGIFLLIGGITLRVAAAPGASATLRFAQLAGLAQRMPLTCFALTVAGLSLIGVPGTAGFVSKWYLILAAIDGARYDIVAAIVLSSLLAVAYLWRFVEAVYFAPSGAVASAHGAGALHDAAARPAPAARRDEAPPSMLVPALAFVFATIWFGIDTSFTLGSALAAAQQLLAGPR
ncbi:MAG: hypothetical protein NZM12_13000, partial [Steroidobacteraceae bacterium]|nr:hypothetical protein [Steroidobacteraceae bacterium]MDW8260366.1 proton-conducting transporter membrane subunit [Gammaproteobacteria bacterium]